MNYIDSLNETIQSYFNVLANNDFPEFIYKYIETDELKRLSKIGLFCGCDYTKLHNINIWYSRLDHSIACALLTWNFTKDKVQTIISLFHDLGTPTFSHCVDFLLNDYKNQESSEKNIKDIIKKSKIILKHLEKDNIDIEVFSKINEYTIIENKTPKICTDRIESIFSSGLFWQNYWKVNDIKKIYQDLNIFKNENDENEIGFNSIDIAEMFFEGSMINSLALQSNEDKFTMQFIADNIKLLLKKNKIKFKDLYNKSEQDIISVINKDNDLQNNWKLFVNSSKLIRCNTEPDQYYVSIDTKKRLIKLSSKSNKLLNNFFDFKDSKYCYIENISQIKNTQN